MPTRHYYNECDPKAAAWLRELMRAGLIPDGWVDERSICDVRAGDLAGYVQCHFFAGIAGWALALQLAGWPADRPVWTGSCPCQPFSAAGKGEGTRDPRHLWPVWFGLIRQCRPEFVFGEQVANAVGHGWLDGVSADLEQEGYTCGAAVLGAHSVGAPHIRQRLYWVADAGRPGDECGERCGNASSPLGRAEAEAPERERSGADFGSGFSVGGVADAECSPGRPPSVGGSNAGGQACRRNEGATGPGECGDASGLGKSHLHGCKPGDQTSTLPRYGDPADSTGFWSGVRLIACRDGKLRRIPVEPSLFPLAHGVPGRLGLLRGSGNAIVPQVAAEFVGAFLDLSAGNDRGDDGAVSA